MKIYCTGCKMIVDARLTNGKEMYASRADLSLLPFWVCDACRAFVGTHYKHRNPDKHYKPLGFLATPEMKRWRKILHEIIDPLWKNKLIERGKIYAHISERIGRTYHTAEIYDVEEAKKIYAVVRILKDHLAPGPWNN